MTAKVKANTAAKLAAVAMVMSNSSATRGKTGSSARAERLAANVAIAMILIAGALMRPQGGLRHQRATFFARFLAIKSKAKSVRTRPSNSRNGTMLGPSEGA